MQIRIRKSRQGQQDYYCQATLLVRGFSFATDAVVSAVESMHTDWHRFKSTRLPLQGVLTAYLCLSVLICGGKKFVQTPKEGRTSTAELRG